MTGQRMKWIYDDGGRSAAGYKGNSGDCVTRAIAIATGKPYQEIYNAINCAAQNERNGKRKRGKSSARDGVYKPTYRKLLESLGWKFTPTMKIGSGCKVHLWGEELPMGTLIVSLSKHLVAVIDRVIHDTSDPQRDEHIMEFNGASDSDDPRVTRRISRRCVYGYFQKATV